MQGYEVATHTHTLTPPHSGTNGWQFVGTVAQIGDTLMKRSVSAQTISSVNDDSDDAVFHPAATTPVNQ